MAMLREKLACALVMMSLVISVSEAASASGVCPWWICGTQKDASIRYPFRLGADPLSNRCYTTYHTFLFECLDLKLYLNITEHNTTSQDVYKVTKIDYEDQTLSLVPHGIGATCRDFDAKRFGGMNITNTTTLLLDCPRELNSNCTKLSNLTFSSPCNQSGSGVVNPAEFRWACPMTLDNFRNRAFSNCKLFETPPPDPLIIPNSTYSLVLQFAGNKTMSFMNFTSSPVESPGPAPTAGDSDAKTDAIKAKKKTLYIILGVSMVFLAAIIIYLFCCLYCCGWLPHIRPRSKTGDFTRKNKEAIGKLQHFDSPHSHKMAYPTTFYTLKELQRATRNFSDECKLGSGGFGTVYMGSLDNGVQVAIKKINDRIVNMKDMSEPFINEVYLLSQVNHRNLVRLHGCCIEVEVPMLVYEYVSNGDLFQHLQGERPGIPNLSWDKRLQIAIDTAEALRYLHSAAYPPIYHRDMKTSNILLDDKFNVKVADFGISKLVKPDATHVSTAVKGTPGYLDPEYFRTFQLTDKSDVYSFGMVLLELVTSLKPVDFQRREEDVNLSEMALPFIRTGDVKAIADPRMLAESAFGTVAHQMQRVGEMACKCLAERRKHRPGMKEVVEELVAIRGVDENGRVGERSSDISDGEHEDVETVHVFKSSNFTSGSDSASTYRMT